MTAVTAGVVGYLLGVATVFAADYLARRKARGVR
jgi:hypothetical protein